MHQNALACESLLLANARRNPRQRSEIASTCPGPLELANSVALGAMGGHFQQLATVVASWMTAVLGVRTCCGGVRPAGLSELGALGSETAPFFKPAARRRMNKAPEPLPRRLRHFTGSRPGVSRPGS